MSSFDPSTFENTVIEGANETKSTPIPEGWYDNCIVDSVRVKSVKTKDRGDVPVLEVNYHLTNVSEDLQKKLNREKFVVRQDIWLDLTEQGTLAFGPNQNLALGRLREACKENDPRKKFTFKNLEGKGPLKIYVNVKDVVETGDSFNNVTKVERQA